MRKILVVLLLSAVGWCLYLWKLDVVPPAVYADEATVGVNAKLMMENGRDEYGEVMPVLFRFFGAYTPGMAVYLLVPMIRIFGLSAVTIRWLSVMGGLASIVVVYASLRRLMNKEQAGWGTVFYAILPWTVFSSRLGYEVMTGHLLYTLGIYFGHRAMVDRKLQGWSILALGLATYVTHTQKYLLPFLLGYLIFVWGIRKITRKAVLILIAVMLPNIVLAVKHPGFWVKNSAIASRPEVVWENFARQYLTYISPKTIFQTNPDIDQQHQIPGLGLAFWWMVIPFGLGWLRIDRKWRWLFLISVIPAAFSGVFISVQRALPMLFPLSIIIGTGLVKAKRPVLAGLVVYSLVLLWRGYFVLLPTINARAWDYGYQQIAKIIEDNPDTEFVFDNTRNPRSYMLVWFYAGRQENVQFRPIDWKADSCRNTVLIGDTLAISETQAGEHKLKFWGEIKDPVGEAVFKYYKTNPAEKCGEI